MVSDRHVPEMLGDSCRCSNDHEHRVVAGQLKSGQLVSDFVAKYTPKFVKTMLNAFGVSGSQRLDHKIDISDKSLSCLAAEPVAPEQGREASAPVEPESSGDGKDEKIKQALIKLHRNLGHPSTTDMIRILKHSRASPQAIEIAGKLRCAVCMN